MLVSSIVIEIKILLIDYILDHFMHHPVQWQVKVEKTVWREICNGDQNFTMYLLLLGARGRVVGSGTMLQAGRLWVQFLMGVIGFFQFT
jgi:hypothetical protein